MPEAGANANASPVMTLSLHKPKLLCLIPNRVRRSVARRSSVRNLRRGVVKDPLVSASAPAQVLLQEAEQQARPRLLLRKPRLPSVARALINLWSASTSETARNVSPLVCSSALMRSFSDWAQIDAFLSNKVACTTLQHCSTHSAHSSAADVAGSSPEHVGHDEDADTDAARAELAAFLAQPIGFDGCDSALTFADVTGRGQLAVFVERQQVAAVSGLVLAGLKFYVNWVRFPLPSEAWIVRPSIDDTVYEFGNACDSCCAKIQARADAASAAGPKFFAEAAGVLLNCHGLSKGPVGIVLAYSCAVKLATELCGPDSCL